jgi:PAS domain S-box-containing protein
MKRIMLVDDEAIITMQLEKRLASMGYEVVGVASSGEESLSMAREQRPDLVLMDIVMPGEMDGIDAASQIRSELAIPIIFLTAFADESHIGRAKQADPFGYIVKPFHEKEIFATIEMALHRKMYEQQLRNTEALYRFIMQKAFDPIILLDHDRYILDANVEATRLLECCEDELIGTVVDEIFNEADREKTAMLLEDTLVGGSSGLSGVAVLTARGRKIRIDISVRRASYGGIDALLIILKCLPRQEKRDGVFRRLLHRDGLFHQTGSDYVTPGEAVNGSIVHDGNMVQICTACKKVKTETGRWIGIESFFQALYGVEFSHGICSECAHEMWPDMPSELSQP